MQICDDSHLRLNFVLPWNLNLHLVWTDHCSYCTCELLQQERKTQSTTLRIMEQESTDIFNVIIHDLNSMSLLGPDCTAIVSLFLRFAESGKTDQAFISRDSSSAFPWNWEDKVKPQGLCSTRTFILLHQPCNLPLSFQWLCVCIFSLRSTLFLHLDLICVIICVLNISAFSPVLFLPSLPLCSPVAMH